MGEVFLNGEKIYLFLHSKIKMYLKADKTLVRSFHLE